MIKANELRIGNLVTWNPKLVSPNNTLPPLQIEVFSIFQNKVSYVFPNIENRVEPFEDDVAQNGTGFKLLEELEPIKLTDAILSGAGFEEKTGLFTTNHFEKGELQLVPKGDFYERPVLTKSAKADIDLSVRYFHQLQNLYFALTGEELEIKLHGQQA